MAGASGRHRRGWLAAVIVAMAALTGTARASQQDRVQVELNRTVTIQYPAVPASDPAGIAYDPDTCDSAPTCDTIPIDVVAPSGVSPIDDFRLKVELDFNVIQTTPQVNGQKFESTEL